MCSACILYRFVFLNLCVRINGFLSNYLIYMTQFMFLFIKMPANEKMYSNLEHLNWVKVFYMVILMHCHLPNVCFVHTKRDETRYNSSAKIEISPSIDVNDFNANESFALSGLHSCYLVKPNTHKQLLIRKWDGIPTIWIYIYSIKRCTKTLPVIIPISLTKCKLALVCFFSVAFKKHSERFICVRYNTIASSCFSSLDFFWSVA